MQINFNYSLYESGPIINPNSTNVNKILADEQLLKEKTMATTLSRNQFPTDADETHRNAYNAAFNELGLTWHWDIDTYAALSPDAGETDRIRVYIETQHPHLLKAYDADFLINAIKTIKARCYEVMAACHTRSAAYIDWAEINKREVGV